MPGTAVGGSSSTSGCGAGSGGTSARDALTWQAAAVSASSGGEDRGGPRVTPSTTRSAQAAPGGVDETPADNAALRASPHISDNSGAEFLRGMVASATNIILTFPLNKLISRQVYEGLSMRDAFHTMRVEGAANLYRGVLPPLLQKGVSMGVCYGAFDFYFHALTYALTGRVESRPATDVPSSESSWGIRGAAAVLSGSTEALFTPFERMQTILQHRHYTDSFSNTADVARKLRPYGIAEYFRGGSAILLRNGPANAIFFLLREPVRNLLPAPPAAAMPVAAAADGAEASRSGLDAAGFRLGSSDGRRTDPQPSVRAAAATAAGAGSSRLVARSTVDGRTNALAHTAALRSTGRLADSAAQPALTTFAPHRAWNIARDFFSGAVLGASLSTIFYPLNTVKSVMQLQIGGRHRGILETMRQVYHERQGIAGMYRGVGGNAVRALLSWGIVNASYEIAKNATR